MVPVALAPPPCAHTGDAAASTTAARTLPMRGTFMDSSFRVPRHARRQDNKQQPDEATGDVERQLRPSERVEIDSVGCMSRRGPMQYSLARPRNTALT